MINNLSDKRIRCMPPPINFHSFLQEERKNQKEINQRITQASVEKKVEGNLLFFFLRSRVHHEILDFRSNFHYFEACIR